MVGAQVLFLRLTRGGPVANAIVWRAQERATFDNPGGRRAISVGIDCELPNIADHVVKAEFVGFEAADWR